MTRASPLAPLRLRRVKAAVIVAAIVAAVPMVEMAVQPRAFSQGAATFADGLDAAYLVEPADADVALARIEDAASAGGADVPEAFSREIGFLPQARDIRSGGDGAVVGYIVPLESEVAAGQLAEHMAARGWTAVSLGSLEGATFVKREGTYRWALATCTQVGSATSVVMRSVIT